MDSRTTAHELYLGRQSIAANQPKLYEWVKKINGDPRPGNSLLMANRVYTFCDLHRRQFFYEPLSGHEAFLRALSLQSMVSAGGWIPASHSGHRSVDHLSQPDCGERL